jgi:plastocyanin
MYVGSVGVFTDGKRNFLGPAFGWDARIANSAATTELPVFSIRNCTSINGVANRGIIRLRSVSFSGQGGTTDCRLRIRRNPTLTGANFLAATSPVFGTATTLSTGYILTTAQSVAMIDIAASAVAALTNGANDVMFNAVAASSTGYQIDLDPYKLFILPGDTVTFTMYSTANNNAVQVSVNWEEDT